MAVNDILNIGQQGLTTNQRALQTTASNIANANTPGFTRRRAVLETVNGSSSSGGLQIGGGVEVKKVIRLHDDFVEKQIVDESHSYGGFKARSENLHKLESVVSRDGDHLGSLVNKFFSDMRELSTHPETAALRNVVSSSASAVTDGFRQMNDSLEGMKVDLDLRINDALTQVNTMTRELAAINNTIAEAESRGDIPNDLYDKRDMLVRDLSKKLDFQVTTDQRGQVNIITAGTVIVQGSDQHDLYALRTPASDEKGPGSLDVFVANKGQGRPVTHGIKDGEIGGMIHVRDRVINPALQHLDKVAYQLATSVNDIHKDGAGLDGATNRTLFKQLTKMNGAAGSFDISDDVKNNHEAIAAGLGGGAGDNQVALKIADLQSSKLLPTSSLGTEAHHTIDESLHTLVGNIGIETQRDTSFYEHQNAVLDQLNNYQQGMAGVSLEEEAVNMIQYQTVFNASAKAMKVGEELFETLLSIKQ